MFIIYNCEWSISTAVKIYALSEFNTFKPRKTTISSTLLIIYKSFKSIVLNLAFPLEITLTVPLRIKEC